MGQNSLSPLLRL